MRASGSLMTPASWIRKFVKNHDHYKHDSVITKEINYDLMWAIYRISNEQMKCEDLLPPKEI